MQKKAHWQACMLCGATECASNACSSDFGGVVAELAEIFWRHVQRKKKEGTLMCPWPGFRSHATPSLHRIVSSTRAEHIKQRTFTAEIPWWCLRLCPSIYDTFPSPKNLILELDVQAEEEISCLGGLRFRFTPEVFWYPILQLPLEGHTTLFVQRSFL